MFFRSSLKLGLVLPGLLESTLKFPIYKLNFQFLMAYLREYYQVVLLLHIVFHFCLREMVKLHALGTFTSSRCCHFEWERTTFVIPGKEKGRWENYRNSTKMYHSTVVLIYLYPTLEKVTLFPWSIKRDDRLYQHHYPQKANGTAHQKQSLWEKNSNLQFRAKLRKNLLQNLSQQSPNKLRIAS